MPAQVLGRVFGRLFGDSPFGPYSSPVWRAYTVRVSTLVAQYGVLVVVLIIYFGEIGVPTLIPGEIAILLAGSRLVHSVPALLGTLVLFSVVDVLGCCSIHLASRTGGNRLLLRLLRRLQPGAACHEEIVEAWRRRLGGHDALVVFVTRLIPVFRFYASITTGLVRIRLRDFVTGAVPASTVWAATPLILGYLLHDRVTSLVSRYPHLINLVILVSIASAIPLAAAWWVSRAGSRAGVLRRVRISLGLAAVGGSIARLALMALYGDGAMPDWSVLPALSALAVWVALLSLAALGLLWIAAHDLGVIRRDWPRYGWLLPSPRVWMGLMGMFCFLNAAATVRLPGLLG